MRDMAEGAIEGHSCQALPGGVAVGVVKHVTYVRLAPENFGRFPARGSGLFNGSDRGGSRASASGPCSSLLGRLL